MGKAYRKTGLLARIRRRVGNAIWPDITVSPAPAVVIAEWNIAVVARDGVTLRVNVFRPANLELRRALDDFIGKGFHSVGFSPMLGAPNGNGEMQAADLKVMLGE